MSLQLFEVSRRFGRQLVLDRLSLHVRPGDCYGFLGHNGAGKTTAMRIVLGLSRPAAGRVEIDGFDAARRPREARARTGGLIEVPGFHVHLDGRANLRLLARVQGVERSKENAEIERCLEWVGLAQVGAKPVQAYSHGMRQRLGIAQALLGSPRYVLLDEPMSGLDPEGIAEVREVLRRAVSEHGATVMLSTHQLHEVEGLCNRVAVISRGRLVLEATTAELFQVERGRYRLIASDWERATQALATIGLDALVDRTASVQRGRCSIDVELAGRAPSQVLRTLLDAGVELEQFAPRPISLEEIYLRHARGERASEPADAPRASPPSAAADRASAESRAPRSPLRRCVRYELERLGASRGTLLVLLMPLVVAALAVWRRARQNELALEQVAGADRFSATATTAFDGVAVALSSGLPLWILVIVGLASQSIAGEHARGTLRNLLLRPVRRGHVVGGKLAAQLGLGVLAFAAFALASVLIASAWFDFDDVTEILPNGEAFVLRPAGELWPELGRALASPVLALVAYGALGALCGTLVRNAAGALALAFGAVLALDLSRALLRPIDAEGWSLAAYLPSPLGDTSYVKFYADTAAGVSNASFAFASGAVVVPVIWSLACFAIAWLVLERRAVP